MKQPTLFELRDQAASAEPVVAAQPPPDQPARDFAVDPRHNVLLEASAGTGKTRVLVDRYARLVLDAGVDPRHILAITFTRKAAAEMRERVMATLRTRAAAGGFAAERWKALQARLSDIQISTIDAFCFGLLREFPLEADVDPDFEVADETETGRFANEALDVTFRTARLLLTGDEHLRLLFTRVKQPRLRSALAALLDRRQVACPAIATFVGRQAHVRTAADAAERFAGRVRAAVESSPHRAALIDDGPLDLPEFEWVRADLSRLSREDAADPTWVQQLRRRLETYFLTQSGKPRQRLVTGAVSFASAPAKKRHTAAVAAIAPTLLDAFAGLDADVNALLARGLLRILAMAVDKYEALLEEHALLDFAAMLDRAVRLLSQQEEFARSRLKLQARYHHLLVDEFQDTSRRQWQLIDLLIGAWAEGEGTAEGRTSIFVVGDRKQSIYRFRQAEVTLLDEAAERIGALRPDRSVRHAINTSFRSVPELLAFVNALASSMSGDPELPDRWRYEPRDEFPVSGVGAGAMRDGVPVLGITGEATLQASASAVAAEVARLLEGAIVRDRRGAPRPARADDVAILFRARAGHQYYEEALETRGIRTYVYKGLGFFDAPEVQDLQAVVRYLAQPDSDLRAAELLRSRVVRLSDAGLNRLSPGLAACLLEPALPASAAGLSPIDADLLNQTRAAVVRWLDLADRIPPGELIDVIVRETAYVYETRGRRGHQARENLKKLRSLIRRVENRGYATLARLAAYFDTLRSGDDSNAIVEAAGAVSLMTVHAAKGLEFPIVFLVNLQAPGKGGMQAVSVIERGPSGEPDVSFGASDATRLEAQRETEELRRLLYVATTRARDRLYLSAELTDGTLRRQPRSLASLLPDGLAALFGSAATSSSGEVVTWNSDHGPFAFRVCRAPSEPLAVQPDAALPTPVETRIVSPLVTTGMRVIAATSTLEDGTAEVPGAAGVPARKDERLIGTIVHRLFQHQMDPSLGDDVLVPYVLKQIDGDERVDLTRGADVAREALAVYRSLRGRADVAALLQSGECFYEVPFSCTLPDQPGVCVRGVIDCLVMGPDGTATVLEFKTGRPRAEHQAQATLYAQAIAGAAGLQIVRTLVCYP
ncbi:MAG: UvrD-helicase domain-containing protein [Vicinamibacterales bacterium]